MKVFHKIEEESISQTNNEEFDEKCCGQKCGTHQNGEAKKTTTQSTKSTSANLMVTKECEKDGLAQKA